MKCYKGFDKELKCRGFQFEIGKTYEEGSADLCSTGFHACEDPIDCFNYYVPAESRYCEVELDANEQKSDDTKRVGKKITIGAEIGIPGIVKGHIEYVKEQCDKDSTNSSTGDRSANSSTGYTNANIATGSRSANVSTGNWSANIATGSMSANVSTGNWSANIATGSMSANSSTGYMNANSSTGDRSANSSTGDRSANSSTCGRSANSSTGDFSANSSTGYMNANSSTGDRSANSSTGYMNANSSTGYGSVNVTTGEDSTNVGTDGCICVGWGINNRCKGDIGAYIVLSEWGEWDGKKYPLLCAKMALVDGETLKPDTWYTLKNGEFIEAN